MKRILSLLLVLSFAGISSAQIVPPGSPNNPFAAGISVPGCTINSVVYISSSGNLACGGAPAPTYDATNILLTVGTGGTTQRGLILGYTGTNTYAGIWPSGTASPSLANYTLAGNAGVTYLGSGSTSGTVVLAPGNATKGTVQFTAGSGINITAGTATTDVQSLSTTQTWNAAGVTFTGHKYTVTDTASAAGSLHSAWYGGAAGSTPLFWVGKSNAAGIGFGSHALFSDTNAMLLTDSAGTRSFLTRTDYTLIPTAAEFGWGNLTSFAFDTRLSRDAAATIQMGLDVNGAPTQQTFKAHDGITGTDVKGASLTLSPGRGTGAAVSDPLTINRVVTKATGTTAQTYSPAFITCPTKILSNTSATAQTIATITTTSATGGRVTMDYMTTASNGTLVNADGGMVSVGWNNNAGTVAAAMTAVSLQTSVPASGTLQSTPTATVATNVVSIKLTPTWTVIVPTVVTGYATFTLHTSGDTVVCQ